MPPTPAQPDPAFKAKAKALLAPLRRAAGSFVQPAFASVDDVQRIEQAIGRDSIIHKAATLIAAEQVEGDYLEFGVYQGASMIRAYHAIRQVCEQRAADDAHSAEHQRNVREQWKRMRFFAFDSFQGLPAPEGVDAHTADFERGKFAASLSYFNIRLERGGVDATRVVPVPGWFNDTCTPRTVEQHQMKHAAIVHIDCDLYESARVALKFIGPLLADGTVLIFDDWYAFRGRPDRGEQRAFNEWTATMPGWTFTQYQKEGPWRNSFIANRKEETT
jgi:hypothetical protein